MLLTLAPGTELEVLRSRVSGQAKRAAELGGGEFRSTLAVRVADDIRTLTAHAAVMAPGSFDAVIEVGADMATFEDLTAALLTVIRQLRDHVDGSRSAALAGTEYVIESGTGRLVYVVALRRLPSMTSTAFHDHWLHVHSRVVRPAPVGRGYRQFHADPLATTTAARVLGLGIDDFEGTALAYFQDLAQFKSVMSGPRLVAGPIADEANFLDQSRSTIGLFQEVPLSR